MGTTLAANNVTVSGGGNVTQQAVRAGQTFSENFAKPVQE
jgi:hypothetical protein